MSSSKESIQQFIQIGNFLIDLAEVKAISKKQDECYVLWYSDVDRVTILSTEHPYEDVVASWKHIKAKKAGM